MLFPFPQKAKPSFVIFWIFLCSPPLFANVVTLQNGDRLTGQIEKENNSTLWLHHESLGSLEISRDQIRSITPETPPAPLVPRHGELAWDRRLAAGYELARGNTDFQRLNGNFLVNRNRLWIDEWTWKGSGTLEESSRKLSVQRGDMSLRYAYSITKKVYNFYRVTAEHDLFEQLRARITPSTGLGYWFADTPALKLLTEAGLGYQMEYFRHDGNKKEVVLHTRGMITKKINDFAETGLDVYYYPAAADFADYRIEAEAFLRFLLSEKFSINIKASDQYRARPKQDAKKNDLRLISALEYAF